MSSSQFEDSEFERLTSRSSKMTQAGPTTDSGVQNWNAVNPSCSVKLFRRSSRVSTLLQSIRNVFSFRSVNTVARKSSLPSPQSEMSHAALSNCSACLIDCCSKCRMSECTCEEVNRKRGLEARSCFAWTESTVPFIVSNRSEADRL